MLHRPSLCITFNSLAPLTFDDVKANLTNLSIPSTEAQALREQFTPLAVDPGHSNTRTSVAFIDSDFPHFRQVERQAAVQPAPRPRIRRPAVLQLAFARLV